VSVRDFESRKGRASLLIEASVGEPGGGLVCQGL
jgi:hypothetical protein